MFDFLVCEPQVREALYEGRNGYLSLESSQ